MQNTRKVKTDFSMPTFVNIMCTKHSKAGWRPTLYLKPNWRNISELVHKQLGNIITTTVPLQQKCKLPILHIIRNLSTLYITLKQQHGLIVIVFVGWFYWYVDGDYLTGALYVLQLQLYPPPPSTLLQ